jgi:hypothetical protein
MTVEFSFTSLKADALILQLVIIFSEALEADTLLSADAKPLEAVPDCDVKVPFGVEEDAPADR